MTLENEKRFLLLLSSFVNGVNATKADVLNTIVIKNWAILSGKDLETKHNRNELVWRNDFAFVRKHLAEKGYFQNGIRNDWSITSSGTEELKHLCGEVVSTACFSYVSSEAKDEAKKMLRVL